MLVNMHEQNNQSQKRSASCFPTSVGVALPTIAITEAGDGGYRDRPAN